MRKFFLVFALATIIISVPTAGFAADPNCPPGSPDALICPLDQAKFSGPEFFVNLINKIANWLFTFLLVLAVAFIVIAAYKYMFSQGSEEAVSAAHKMLIYAMVAVAVAMLSRGFVYVVRSLITDGTATPAATAPAVPDGGSPSETPVVSGPIDYRITNDAGTTVTSAELPFSAINIYACVLPSGIHWIPAFKFLDTPGVTKVQGGCSISQCVTHEERYGPYDIYPVSGGPRIAMERCADGTSPKFIYMGQAFGGTP